ncbi:hypothetical protein, partial [Borreliella garinii]
DQYGLFKILNKDYIDNILIIFNAKPREKRISIKCDKLSKKNKKEKTRKFFGWKLFWMETFQKIS